MRKRLLTIILSFLCCINLSSCKSKEYEPQDYILEMEYVEDFKILQLTDLHIGNKDDRQAQYDYLSKVYEDAGNINLVVVTGDLFTFADRKTAKELFSFFDSKKIPWTVTFGNHDEQCYFSIEWLTGYLNKLTKSNNSYCKFIDNQDDDVHGNANFAINLMLGSNLMKQIIVMDSNRYHFGVEGSTYMYYDYIHEDQIEWYKNLVRYTKSQYGSYESLLFYHIEIPEYNYIFDFDEETGEATLKDGVELILGSQREKVCCPEYNSGFYDVIKEENSTIAMFVGHDHTNDFIAKYDGIYFCYGVTSTDRIYYEDGLIGGLVVTIENDDLSFRQVIQDYEG